MNNKNKSMLHGPLLPGIIQYTIPVILTSVLQLLFNAADLVIVGRFCGSVSVAAVGATGAAVDVAAFCAPQAHREVTSTNARSRETILFIRKFPFFSMGF